MKNKDTKQKITSKQIVAIVGIVLLALLYIVTLVLAIIGTEATSKWFVLSLMATIFVPIIIWIYTWLYGKMTGKKTIADSDVSLSQTASNSNE